MNKPSNRPDSKRGAGHPLRRRVFAPMLLCGLLAVAPAAMAQSERVSLDLTGQPVTKVLKDIEKQTDYTFVYRNNVLSGSATTTVKCKARKLSEVLGEMLAPMGLTYSLSNRVITITPRPAEKAAAEKKPEARAAQVTGTVVDENGDPLIGATVAVKGDPSKIVSTDVDGRYTLNAAPGSELIITYVGYEAATTKAGEGRETTLSPSAQNLDEVVVVGYGVQKKVNVVGSIATVDSKDLEGRTGGTVSNMINGHLSGVTITQGSGRPGSDGATIRVRGIGSFGATPAPLVLVDGVPGDLDDITPAEIESISVLKDAASSAIYGSRAANGVILVTTKNGREGKTRVTYNGSVGWSSPTKIPDMAHSYEYAEFYNMAVGTETFTQEMIQKFRDGSDPYNYADEMYLEELLDTHPVQTKHELSVSGGTQRVNYQLTGAYMRNNGFLPRDSYDRFNARLNLSAKLAHNLTLNAFVTAIFGTTHTPHNHLGQAPASFVYKALTSPTIYPSFMEDGSIGLGPDLDGTAIGWLKSRSFGIHQTDRYKSQLNLVYEIIPGLQAKVIGGFNSDVAQGRSYTTPLTFTDGHQSGTSELSDSWSRDVYKTFQAILDYNVDLGRNHIGALIGYTWEDNSSRSISGSRINYPSDDVPYLSAGGVDDQKNGGGASEWAVQSVIGRLNYNYDERYLLEGTFRYDGSSRFPTSHKYGFFPSVGAGWRIVNEKFWKENENLSFVNNLKLRASYGVLGNNRIGNYPYQSVYAFGSHYVFGGILNQGASINTYVDPNLKWEKTHTWDIGLETGFFNNRLTFNANYFDRTTKDILFAPSANYSSIFGLGVSPVNTGRLTNRGWEFELGHRNRIGRVGYHVSANFSIINNKVQTLGLGNVTQNNGMVGNGSLFIGYPMQMIYGYKSDGVFLTEDEIKEWPDQSAVAKGYQVGDIRYKDLDGDGKVTTADRTYLGSRIPRYNFGLSAGIDWKGFDLSFLFQGVAGVKGTLSTFAAYAFYQDGNIQRWQMEGCWNVQQDNRYPAYPRLEVLSNAGSANTLTSDFWVRNAWFLKCRNIQFGYTVPAKAVKSWGLNSIRAYVTLDNPFCFDNYPTGWDPENRSNNGSFYPMMRSYTFGLSVNI